MKRIPLSQGQLATVDDSDFSVLSSHKWYAWWSRTTKTFYAVRSVGSGRKKRTIYMHRQIVGETGPSVDHRDHNGLNNCRSNLRRASASENSQNCRKSIGCSSVYKGVSLLKKSNRWKAYIKIHQRQIYLGRFDTESSAAEAYNRAAKLLFGEFALLNEVHQ